VPRAAGELDVELVHWPGDEARRRALAADGVAVLLLVAADEAPPEVVPTEDWIRVPAAERDVAIRVGALAHRLRRPPRVVDGALVVGTRTIQLARREAALLGPLLAEPGKVVARAELEAALWPQGAPSRRALDDTLFRLRHQRLGELGLEVVASYGRGFSLQPLTTGERGPAEAEAV
jgi:DNA-binding response OmpR family regulator